MQNDIKLSLTYREICTTFDFKNEIKYFQYFNIINIFIFWSVNYTSGK